MVNYKTAARSLWNGRCSVFVRQGELNKQNGRTEFNEVLLHDNLPCRLSHKSVTATSGVSNAAVATSLIKLFLSNDVAVPAGSKIVVTQNGTVGEYQKSGEPAVYSGHMEIVLERFKKWV